MSGKAKRLLKRMAGKQFRGFDHRNIIRQTLQDVAVENAIQVTFGFAGNNGFDDWGQIHTTLRHDGKYYATFMMQQMPGCCAVLTLSYVQSDPDTRREFKNIVSLVEDAARRAGFGSLILTQVPHKDRVAQDEPWGLLLKDGYEMSKPFLNAKSGNQVVYLTKDLGQEKKIAGLEQEVWA